MTTLAPVALPALDLGPYYPSWFFVLLGVLVLAGMVMMVLGARRRK